MVGTDIDIAIRYLEEGGLVAVPTETVYGLAANAFNPDAVVKIFKIKNRPRFNPLIIHTDSISRIRSWGLQVPDKMRMLAEKFSPGPLTYVIPKSDSIPDIVTAGTPAVAVRIPDHPLTLELLRRLDFPLAAPSANPSGFVSPTSAWHVHEQLGEHIPYILNGGECRVGVESTIISFMDKTPAVLRFGGLSLEKIEAVIGKVDTAFGHQHSDKPFAPGMLSRHYATAHKLIVGNIAENLKHYSPARVGIISFYEKFETVPATQQAILSPVKNLDEAAQKLFAAMRAMDKMDIDVILAEKFPDEGLGRAINDRLRRASVQE